MRIFAVLLFVAGIGCVVAAYLSRREVRGYSESVVAKVSQRTPDFAAVAFTASIPGGKARYELPYSSISGSSATAPPNPGDMKVGEMVRLAYPPGKPGAARIPDTLSPRIPTWIAWLGSFWIVMAGLIAYLYRPPSNLPDS